MKAAASSIVSCSSCGSKNRLELSRSEEAVCGKCRTRLVLQASPTILTDQNFSAETTNTELPVLVDLWAAWCGPCRMIAPIIEALAGELAGRAKVCKLDVDANTITAAKFGVQSIPTLLILKNGVEVDRLVGSQSKEAVLMRLTPLM